MEIIDHPSEPQWREALADPAATFFHTPEWSRLMEKAFPGSVEACPAGFLLPDGATAVLPLARLTKLRGLARSLHSMFPGVYGGPVCNRPLTNEERLAINEWLAGREGMRTFTVTPPGMPNPVPAKAVPLRMSTQRLGLRPDLDLMESDILSHGKKYSVKRAMREGVEMKCAESVEAWREYFRAYLESARRWRGASAYQYPPALFDAMGEAGYEGVNLWVATVRGRFAAGAVIVSHGSHIVTWHEASFSEYHRMGVNDCLHVRIIEDAARRGYPYFDFNPSGGHPGVEKYKASFGAEKVPLEAWVREQPWVRAAKRLKATLR